MSSIRRRAVAVALGVTLLSTPAIAHGGTAAATGLSFPLVAADIVLVSPVGGGFVLVTYGRLPWSTGLAALPALVFALGGAALGLAGALVVAWHAAVETAVVGSLYATAGRQYTLGANPPHASALETMASPSSRTYQLIRSVPSRSTPSVPPNSNGVHGA